MNSNLTTKLSIATATACLIGAFAAAAFAGPPPQLTIRPPAAAKAEVAPNTDCPACKTSDIRVARQSGPAGKSTTEWTTVATKHECSMCQGAMTSAQSGSTDSMVHNAMNCGPKLCCVAKTR